jgi:hypothetical protein
VTELFSKLEDYEVKLEDFQLKLKDYPGKLEDYPQKRKNHDSSSCYKTPARAKRGENGPPIHNREAIFTKNI